MCNFFYFLGLFTLLVLSGCGWRPGIAYKSFYSHLNVSFNPHYIMRESDYFLIILVDAPHLDYSSNEKLIQTIAQHPNGSRQRDVGHAWIYLKGIKKGKPFAIEGGHSGELGDLQPKYFDGIMNYIEYGDLKPSFCKKEELNPIKYLWAVQRDGFFQTGSGRHRPTFAAKIDLSQEQFEAIYQLIQRDYCYSDYSLVHNQCCALVARAAEKAGWIVDYKQTIDILPSILLGEEKFILWKDAGYSTFTFGSPDVLEKSLMRAVLEGKAEYALPWYKDLRRLNK